MFASKNTQLLNKIISAKADLIAIDSLNTLHQWQGKVIKLLTDSGVDMEATINDLKKENPNDLPVVEANLYELVLNKRKESATKILDKIIIHLKKKIEDDKSKPNFLSKFPDSTLLTFILTAAFLAGGTVATLTVENSNNKEKIGDLKSANQKLNDRIIQLTDSLNACERRTIESDFHKPDPSKK